MACSAAETGSGARPPARHVGRGTDVGATDTSSHADAAGPWPSSAKSLSKRSASWLPEASGSHALGRSWGVRVVFLGDVQLFLEWGKLRDLPEIWRGVWPQHKG